MTKKRLDRICQLCPTKITTKDSIIEKTTITPFDTAVWIANRKGKDQAFQNCDSLMKALTASNNTLTTKENGIKSTITNTGGKLTFKCESDSLKEVIRLLRLKKYKERITEKTIEVPAKCALDHRTKWDGFTHWVTIITGGVLLLAFLIFLAKKYLGSLLPFRRSGNT